ncbi:MAG: sigma-E processing peptidase SpoIIGA, partial [Clostridia bacterium]|nr:sigma-E processing peptidase SpoIIGA [Clostridia bacterium]
RGAPCAEAAEWGHGYRLVAARGAFGGEALLPAFRPDSAAVCGSDGERTLGEVFVAVVGGPLSSDGRYDSLAGDALLREAPESVKRSKGAIT